MRNTYLRFIPSIVAVFLCWSASSQISKKLIQKINPTYTDENVVASDEIKYWISNADIKPVECPFTDVPNPIYVPFNKARFEKSNVPVSNFEASLFSFPPEAVAPFEYALTILEELLPSPITINVGAVFTQLDGGTLASAGTTAHIVITGGGLPDDTSFPIALAEKLVEENINGDNFDIVVQIDEGTNWYYDFENPDGINGQFDFVTVILHELFHGLGMASNTFVNGSDGIIFPTDTITFTDFLFYDRLLADGQGRSLLEEIPNVSFEMGSLLRSNNLFWEGDFFRINRPTDLPKIYAPSAFSSTSSISHLDQITYSRTVDGLMTPNGAPDEIIHDPGISLEMLYDLGWNRTAIFLEHGFFTEDVNEDMEFLVRVTSDFPFDTSTLLLFYFEGDFNFLNLNRVPLEYTGEDNMFRAVLPAPGEDRMINFYYSVRNSRNISVSNPFSAPNQFFRFSWGEDQILPEISHSPVTSINENESSFIVLCSIIDEFTGVDSAFVEYNIEGKTSGVENLITIVDQFGALIYGAIIEVGDVDSSDVINYRIVAVDGSSRANEGTLPSEGFFQVKVNPIAKPVSQYVSDFDDLVDDFIGEGFSVRQEDGFSSPAIHSTHPYGDAGSMGLSFFNSTYELKFPVVIASENAEMTFDEVVLIEPGELNTQFGETEFWDFAVVEAKFFDDTQWFPIVAGYDSRSNPAWSNKYNESFSPCPEISAITQCISNGEGDESLFRSRRIGLAIPEVILPGDTLFLRFRLFSDPAAFGWGWAIDNLSIQGVAITTKVEEVELVELFDIRPNPVQNDHVQIALQFEEFKQSMQVGIRDINGRVVYSNKIQNVKSTQLELNTSAYPAGVYFVTIADKKGVTTKKMIVSR